MIVLKYYVKKYYLRRKINKTKLSIIIQWDIKIYVKHNQKQWTNCFQLCQITNPPHYHFKLDSQKLYQHTGGKRLIHGTKHHKDKQLQILEI